MWPVQRQGVMRIALFEPDIPQNTGTILRLAACLGVEAHIIEPAGFPVSDRAFRRAGMDYLDQVVIVRHLNWEAFEAWRRHARARLLLFTTRAGMSYLDHAYRDDDVLLFGRESAGTPEQVHQVADARLVIPIRNGLRSLNVAMAAAMALGEAMRKSGRLHRPVRIAAVHKMKATMRIERIMRIWGGES
jgi:tRNA (cytidine/uridine-2'-O-)-methyltransferase